jgi:hypothetical protein
MIATQFTLYKNHQARQLSTSCCPKNGTMQLTAKLQTRDSIIYTTPVHTRDGLVYLSHNSLRQFVYMQEVTKLAVDFFEHPGNEQLVGAVQQQVDQHTWQITLQRGSSGMYVSAIILLPRSHPGRRICC